MPASLQQPSTANRQPSAARSARPQPPPYSRGQYDRLINPPVHADPDDIRGVTFEIAVSGLSIIVTELTSSGRPVRHLIRDGEWPYFVDIKLPDGREVQIEARIFEPVAGPPEKRRQRQQRGNGSSSSSSSSGSSNGRRSATATATATTAPAPAATIPTPPPEIPPPPLSRASLHRFTQSDTIAGEDCI